MNEELALNSYWLDAGNRIVRVGPAWNRFAAENDGARVLATAVLGRPMEDFICGDVTRMWFDTLLKLCRLRGTALARPYRCDTPSKRRYMQMEVVPEEDGILRLDHRLLKIEPIQQPVSFRAAAVAAESDRLRCSLCGRVSPEGADWREPEPLPARQGAPLLVIYTVCQDCKRLLPAS